MAGWRSVREMRLIARLAASCGRLTGRGLAGRRGGVAITALLRSILLLVLEHLFGLGKHLRVVRLFGPLEQLQGFFHFQPTELLLQMVDLGNFTSDW